MKKEKDMKRIAMVTGSFDPVTMGHDSLVRRALSLADEVIVAAFINAERKYRFSQEEILKMLHLAFDGMENVRVDSSSDMVADYAAAHGVTVIVRGARNAADFDYESRMAEVNRRACPTAETVILPCISPAYVGISSTEARRRLETGEDLTGIVPAAVVSWLKEKEN